MPKALFAAAIAAALITSTALATQQPVHPQPVAPLILMPTRTSVHFTARPRAFTKSYLHTTRRGWTCMSVKITPTRAGIHRAECTWQVLSPGFVLPTPQPTK